MQALADALEVAIPAGSGSLVLDGIAIDSRTLSSGQLFVAIRGETHDGHAYLEAAEAAGMAAALVDARGAASAPPGRAPRIVVGDTAAALLRLGALCRAQHAGPVVGITGSNGKTTTKELVAAALMSKGAIHKTTGNLNNHFGVPLTLAAWPKEAGIAVIEMGMSAAGEIAQLATIAAPEVGLVTCVAAAHLQGLGTIEQVASAKAELFAGLVPRGIAILNDDDVALGAVAPKAIGTRSVIRFGHREGCDVRVLGATSSAVVGPDGALAAQLLVSLAIGGHTYEARVPVFGEHNAMNVAAAVAAAWALGVAPTEALAGMQKVVVPGSRALLRRLPHRGGTLLDDCYNANPGSVAAALRSVAALGGRSLAVLGDMLELGPSGPSLHEEVGREAVRAGVDEVWSVGQHAAHFAAGVTAEGGRARAFADVEALLGALPARFAEVDTWLVKGSRGMRLERVVTALLALDVS